MSSAAFAQGATEKLDLSGCAREPIHVPGTIQPKGILLVLEPASLLVLQGASSRGPDTIQRCLNRPIQEVLGGALARYAEALSALAEDDVSYLGHLRLSTEKEAAVYQAVAHRRGGVILIELEEEAEEPGSSDALYATIRSFLEDLERTPSVEAMCARAAQEVRRITGLDRVLIYRFDEGWNGTVIAEDRNDILPSYLDLRFPASDIPAQARELYRLNRIRLISDCDYLPVPIEPARNPLTGQPTDLSLAVLRSVSPVHLQYMRNMGTGASMSISLLRSGALWGLISCHNQAPAHVPYHIRTACDFLAQVLSMQVTAKEQAAEAQERIARGAYQARLLTRMAAAEDFVDGLIEEPADLLALTGATGAAIVDQSRCLRLGEAPEEEQIRALVEWIGSGGHHEAFRTNSLAAVLPQMEQISQEASGVLAVPISQMHQSYVLWFRPEVVRTVRWGGDPRKPVGDQLSPRTSFESWKETVRMQSAPWSRVDADAGLELRAAIVDIVLRKAEEMADLNEQLVRSNKELEAFSYSVSHDLRAPFRHIVGYSELLMQRASEKLDDREHRYISTIIDSARSAGQLIDSLLSFSQMGRSTIRPIAIDMNRLADEARRQLALEQGDRSVSWEIGELPSVEGDPTMLRLVFQNLFANALKFTRGRDDATILVGAEARPDEHVFHVKDNGCGFDMAYAGKLFGVFQRLHHQDEYEGVGIGLANVRRIVERHGGRTFAESVPGEGATIFFTLPIARFK